MTSIDSYTEKLSPYIGSNFAILSKTNSVSVPQCKWPENAMVVENKNHILIIWNERNVKHNRNNFKKNQVIIGCPIYTNKDDKLNKRGHYLDLKWDERSILITGDPGGIIPIYQCEDPRILTTSLAFMEDVIGNLGGIQKQGVLESIFLGYSIKPDTEYKKVNQLLPSEKPVIEKVYYSLSPSSHPFFYETKKHAIFGEAANLISYYEDLKKEWDDDQIDFGLSGGLDSRLNLSLLDSLNFNYSPHTLHKGKNNLDAKIAHQLGALLNKEVREEQIRSYDQFNFHAILENARQVRKFYNNRALSINSYLSSNYTKKTRQTILGGRNAVLAGFGGEIYRNYNYFPPFKVSFKDWLFHFVFFKPSHYYKDSLPKYFIPRIKEKLEYRLKEDLSNVDSFKHMKYYTKVFLPDCIGIKIQVENQIAFYLAPFVDGHVTNRVPAFHKYIGFDYNFEISLIKHILPQLGNVLTNYGFVPAKQKLKHRFMLQMKSYSPLQLREVMQLKAMSNGSTNLTGKLKVIPELKELVSDFWQTLEVSQPFDALLKASEPGETLISQALNTYLSSK